MPDHISQADLDAEDFYRVINPSRLYYAAKNGGSVYGPFSDVVRATEFTYAYERMRYPKRVVDSGPYANLGWFITRVFSEVEGYTEAREHRQFDKEHAEHDRQYLVEES